MIVPGALVRGYFAPPRQSPWRWTDDGTAVVWSSGETIAFREEIAEVLRRLAPCGLPPFGAVVMFLAACRDGWGGHGLRKKVADFAELAAQVAVASDPHQGGVLPVVTMLDAKVATESREVLEGLDALHRLPPDLRKGVAVKAALAEAAFETCEPFAEAGEAEVLLAAFEKGLAPEERAQGSRNDLYAFMRELDALRGLRALDEAALRRRLRTGLEEEIAPAEEGLTPALRVRRLLAALRKDPDGELSALARLALDLMAAVHIPRALAQRDELPLGGYSDIANRGSLDRLLPSELAHDDLTLSLRVALGEALYLRREAPPSNPPQVLGLLLDSGIRTWGVARVFAAAVGLALAASGEDRSALLAFRACGKRAVRADLTAREGLLEHLSALEIDPHPGAALPGFFAQLERAGTEADAVLITHAQAFADPEFTRHLAALGERSLLVATVDASGAYAMYQATARGHTPLRKAALNLAGILRPPDASAPSAEPAPLVRKRSAAGLPVILGLDPFPLLLPFQIEPRMSRLTQDGALIGATADGRLMKWSDPKRGARQLTDQLPYALLPQVMLLEDREALLLANVGSHKPLLILRVDLQTGAPRPVPLDAHANTPKHALLENGKLILIYKRLAEAFDPRSGEKTDACEIPAGAKWVREGFFTKSGSWHVLTYNGQRLVLLDTRVAVLAHCGIWKRPGQGVWALSESGNAFGGGMSMDFTSELRGAKIRSFLDASQDSHRVAVQTDPPNASPAVLDLENHRARFPSDPYPVLEPRVFQFVANAPNRRAKLHGLSVTAEGELCLIAKRGRRVLLKFYPLGRLYLAAREDPPPSVERVHTFKAVQGPPGTRYELRVAAFEDGTRIYVDARGLLHLKSSDAALPEIALVLSDTHMAAWASNGACCGPAYFMGDPAPGEPARFYEWIRGIVKGLR